MKDYHLDELAKSVDSVCYWQYLADWLGFDDDEKRSVEDDMVDDHMRTAAVHHVPSYFVLQRWRERAHSGNNVRALRHVIDVNTSDELLQKFDELRKSKCSY